MWVRFVEDASGTRPNMGAANNLMTGERRPQECLDLLCGFRVYRNIKMVDVLSCSQ